MNKKRSIIDYASITPDLMQALLIQYPYGFENKTIRFKNANGELITAVPLETETVSYLVKVGSRLTERLDAFANDDMEEDDLEKNNIDFEGTESFDE